MSDQTDDDELTDDELKEQLTEIDNDDDIDVTPWEADFIDNVLFKQTFPLTARQREIIEQIIERYE